MYIFHFVFHFPINQTVQTATYIALIKLTLEWRLNQIRWKTQRLNCTVSSPPPGMWPVTERACGVADQLRKALTFEKFQGAIERERKRWDLNIILNPKMSPNMEFFKKISCFLFFFSLLLPHFSFSFFFSKIKYFKIFLLLTYYVTAYYLFVFCY